MKSFCGTCDEGTLNRAGWRARFRSRPRPQTRGKFGLGAKMVNIWAKKTTGQPVQIRSAQQGKARTKRHRCLDETPPQPLSPAGVPFPPALPPGFLARLSLRRYHCSVIPNFPHRFCPQRVSHYVLDLDLALNRPKIIEMREEDNAAECASALVGPPVVLPPYLPRSARLATL